MKHQSGRKASGRGGSPQSVAGGLQAKGRAMAAQLEANRLSCTAEMYTDGQR